LDKEISKMDVYNLTYEYNGQLTNEDVDNVLCTALEGGINYWTSTPVKVPEWPEGAEYASDVVTKNKSIFIFDEDEEVWMELNLEKTLMGIKTFLAGRDLACDFIQNGDYDAGDADLMIQYALFGKIVYG
jgi:hypothetical protein